MQRLKLGSTVRNLLVDAAIFLGFLLATDPHATGQTITNGWASPLGWASSRTCCCTGNGSSTWCGASSANYRGRSESIRFEQPAVHRHDAHHFLGLMISKVVLSTFGLEGQHDGIWRVVHSTATNVALIIVGLHVALHWKWIVGTLKRTIWQPIFGRRQPQPQPALAREQEGAR